MSVLSDHQIRDMCQGGDPMIEPFLERTEGGGIITYGLSSYGYDARLSEEFLIPQMVKDWNPVSLYATEITTPLNPKDIKPYDFRKLESSDPVVLGPGNFVLARTIERFKIPRHIVGICTGKSTYARCGILVNVTPLEPEWEGTVTLEISNTSLRPVMIFPNEGICQFTFHVADEVCEVSYADRKGKYQGQTGVTLAKVT
jgi:dCTP deaminase